MSTSTDDEREAQGWREANLYAVDSVSQDDFMSGWRTADRLRRPEECEPSDAQIEAAAREYHERGNGEGSFDRMADHVRTSLLFRMGCALRAAGGAR